MANESEDEIVVTVYATIPKKYKSISGVSYRTECINCNSHIPRGHTSKESKCSYILDERVQSGHSGSNTYIYDTIVYRNIENKVPDDIISRNIKSIYDNVGKDRIENEPICVDDMISIPMGSLEGFNILAKNIDAVYRMIFLAINKRTLANPTLNIIPDTRSIFKVVSLLESTEIRDNTIDGMTSSIVATGTNYILRLTRHMDDGTIGLSADVVDIASRVSKVLVDNNLVRPSEVYTDVGNTVRLLRLFANNIEDGNIDMGDAYTILLSIGYIMTSDKTRLNSARPLYDYTVVREARTK